MMNETLGKVHFWLSFVGTYCIFMPFPLPGTGREHPPLFNICGRLPAAVDPVHRWITVAALITGAAQLVFCLQPDSQPVLGQAGAG